MKVQARPLHVFPRGANLGARLPNAVAKAKGAVANDETHFLADTA